MTSTAHRRPGFAPWCRRNNPAAWAIRRFLDRDRWAFIELSAAGFRTVLLVASLRVWRSPGRHAILPPSAAPGCLASGRTPRTSTGTHRAMISVWAALRLSSRRATSAAWRVFAPTRAAHDADQLPGEVANRHNLRSPGDVAGKMFCPHFKHLAHFSLRRGWVLVRHPSKRRDRKPADGAVGLDSVHAVAHRPAFLASRSSITRSKSSITSATSSRNA